MTKTTNDYPISMDFLSDLKALMLEELQSASYAVDSSASFEDVCHRYHNVRRRRVRVVPRMVVKSNEFTVTCDYEDAVEALLGKVRIGLDINPHLSKTLLDSDFKDHLLNDWGIHHFHLGITVDDSGFVERSGPLLFARVTDIAFYVLTVMGHKKWSDKKLVKIIDANWPQTIDNFLMRGVLDMDHVLTESERELFRQNGIQAPVRLDNGKFYLPIGGGYASDGTSVEVVRTCIELKRQMKIWEEEAKSKICCEIEAERLNGCDLDHEIRIKLVFRNGRPQAVAEKVSFARPIESCNDARPLIQLVSSPSNFDTSSIKLSSVCDPVNT